MFADCIKKKVHPATWAVVGHRKAILGEEVGHRGTAFAVDTRGHLLTCWHVSFADEENSMELERITVLQPEINLRLQLDVDVVARDKDRDLALLKIRDRDQRTTPLQLNAGDRIPFGRSCCAFGHPLSVVGKDGIRIFTRAGAGVLSMPFESPRFEGCRPIKMYEVDFFTHGGISGGPLFLDNGCVFGVVSGSRMLDHEGVGPIRSNLSIAIDIWEAVEFLQPLGVKLELAGHVGGDVVPKKTQRHGASRGRRKGR